MRRAVRLLLVVMVMVAGLGIGPAQTTRAATSAVTVPAGCVSGTLPHGALSLYCVPADWNGKLIVWGHGYTAFNEPLDFQHINLPNGISLPEVAQNLGLAFATTSYRRNGLAILEGADDIRELVAAFPTVTGRTPTRTYMVGASEGGIITAHLIEQSPQLFRAGLSVCGPIGDFKRQLNYWGDFRVLFDYFFPNVLPGSAVQVPAEVINNWSSVYQGRVRSALLGNLTAARTLMTVAQVPINIADTNQVLDAADRVLWYSVFATNDGVAQFGGNPLDNVGRFYTGSSNDLLLNTMVKRYSADPAALTQVARYETSGLVRIPLLTLHTTGDPLIPAWHQQLYTNKARITERGSLTALWPIERYGHCNFTAAEMGVAFTLLVLK